MSRRALLARACGESGVLAAYLFGSRAEDGLRALDGLNVSAAGSDLDVGIVLSGHAPGLISLGQLQIALEDVFAPLRVDLVPLQRVDALFHFRALDGHRVFTADSTRADLHELVVMRRAAELMPVQRQLERDTFGVTTT